MCYCNRIYDLVSTVIKTTFNIFIKTHRKTLIPESLFNRVKKVFSFKFCEIFKNTVVS